MHARAPRSAGYRDDSIRLARTSNPPTRRTTACPEPPPRYLRTQTGTGRTRLTRAVSELAGSKMAATSIKIVKKRTKPFVRPRRRRLGVRLIGVAEC